MQLKQDSNFVGFGTTVNWDMSERLRVKFNVVRTAVVHPKHFRLAWNFFLEREDFTLQNIILNFRSEVLD